MPELLELCQRLAQGTAGQKQRAWKRFVAEGLLWRSCAEAVRQAAGFEGLAAAFDHLHADWPRALITEAEGGVQEAEVRAALRCSGPVPHCKGVCAS